MENTSYVALSLQGALRRQMDVVANNLANMSTHGYKAGSMMFVEHLAKSKKAAQQSLHVSRIREISQR